MTKVQINRRVRAGWIAALILAFLTFITSLMTVDPQFQGGVEAGLLLVLAYGVYLRNRESVVLLCSFMFYDLSRREIMVRGGMSSELLIEVFWWSIALCCAMATHAIFAHHKLLAAEHATKVTQPD